MWFEFYFILFYIFKFVFSAFLCRFLKFQILFVGSKYIALDTVLGITTEIWLFRIDTFWTKN